MKTAQNLEQLRLASSIHNKNSKNDEKVLDIIISKNSSLDFCCQNAAVKIRKTCAKIGAKGFNVRCLIEKGNNLFKLALCRSILLWHPTFLRKQVFPMKYIFIAYLKPLL